MKSIGELVLLALTKAGISEESEAYTNVVAKKDLFNMAIDETAFSKVDSDLIGFEEAKTHPLIAQSIKSKSKVEVLDALDKQVLPKALRELAIDDSEVADILSMTNTYEKTAALMKKVAELSVSKAGTTNKGDKAELTKQIEALNQQVLQTKQQADEAIKAAENKFNGKLADLALNNLLTTKNFALKDLPKEVNLLTSKQLIDSELQVKGAMKVFDPETNQFKLVTASAPDVPYHESNKPVTFETFADRVLLEKKVISPNQSPAQAAPSGGNQQSPQSNTQPLTGLSMKMAEKIKQFEQGTSNF